MADAFHWLVASNDSGLQPLDWVLLVLYALSMIALGWYFGRKQETTEEYFVGSGNMNPFLIGISLFATLLSTISYLSMPGESLGKGPVVNVVFLAALPLVYVVVAYWLLPVYMQQRVTSAYELLEARLGLGVRLLGAIMFLALRLVWMSLLIYLAAQAMVVMLSVPKENITWIVLVTGIVSVIYTSLGGLRAVVVTDFLQSVLLLGGALLVIATVTWDFGGFGWFPTHWHDNWDTQPFFSFDPGTRVTVIGTVISIFTWYVATIGGDQTSVQRFMATTDAHAARHALLTQLCMSAVVSITLCLVGLSLLGYYSANASLLPPHINLTTQADRVFPHYISFQLPVGISGLVVAAMFAAAMSSVDSGVNSITAVVTTDLLDRFGLKPKTEKGHVLFARTLAFVIGAVVVVGSAFMENIPGNITAVTQKTVNLLTTPIFALFVFALFIPFARPLGVWCGALAGTLTAAVIGFSGPICGFLATFHNIDPSTFGTEWVRPPDADPFVRDPISFQWIGPVALIVNLAVGSAISWLQPGKPPPSGKA